MAAYETDLEKKIKSLRLNDKTDINILLLGETGVGKSTFINSIANYLTYTDFQIAQKENLLILIPSVIKIKDKNNKYQEIKIGNEADANEFLDTGVSATQEVKTYVFPIWNGKAKVRLIDTPGMGDTRGIKQDDINCENILSYIGQLHELHAICFLFKPTNSRITVFFHYCMSQILSRLDKSASNNLIFIFTNTRGSDYGPGETISILQKVVKDIKDRPPHVDIPVNTNVFCFDNEAFRYLAAVKEHVEFDNSVKLRNKESWKKSAEQCWSLIKYIVGDANNPPLKPHFIKNTSAINEARRLIVQLSQPLAEISQLINDNLFVLQRHQQHLNLNKISLNDLKNKLYMPAIDLEVIKLTQPVTVCTSLKCAEICKVGEIEKWNYKQRCHDPCYLTNVQKEIINNPELLHCAAMNGRTCKKCRCDFSTHMHIYYMTNTIEIQQADPSIKKNIDTKEKLLENAKKLIDDISAKKEELEKEHSIIVKCCARFAHFLQNNAISPFNDSYKCYIEYLINREKSLGTASNMQTIQHLEKLLQEYEEMKESFDQSLRINEKLGRSEIGVTPKEIQDSITELYTLKHNGKKIKELYECQKMSRNKEHKFTEYVHDIVRKQLRSDKDSDKDDKKQLKKKDDFKNKQFNKVNSKNHRDLSQMQRPTTPPPSYRDISANPSEPPYGHPSRTGIQYPTDPYNINPYPYSSQPYVVNTPHSQFNYQGQVPPYPPPQGNVSFAPKYNRRPEIDNSYELKVTINKSNEEPHPSSASYIPRNSYPPYDPYYYQHTHGPFSPYVQPPPPPRHSHYDYPAPHNPYGPPLPPPPAQYNDANYNYRQLHPSNANPRKHIQNEPKYGKNAHRGGGINKNKYYKQRNRNQKNKNSCKSDDEDSDSSVASSKK